ncbi:cvpA family protein [mine drainage metagenome]|uniref:CvpA family protein n=1 Tax=mine drainage metagenome TaxID=410659 RepID=T1B798_9ZZZZ
MSAADYAIVAVIAISVLLGLWRGLIAEVLALAVWVAALWAAWQFGERVSAYMPAALREPSARLFAAWALIFVLVLIIGAVLGWLLRMLVQGTGLSGTDRMLGMLFGAARGVLIVTLGVLLLGMTPFPRDPWWRQSALIPGFQRAAEVLQARLPPGVARYVRFDPAPLPVVKLPFALPSRTVPPPSSPES